MKRIDATTRLKEKILIKETEQAAAGALLKNDLYILKENLRPANIMKRTFKDMVAPSIGNAVLDTSIGLGAGYVSKKIISGVSGNPLVKLMIPFLQFGISTLVMKHPEAIKSMGGFILKKIFKKKEPTPERSI